MRRMMLVLLLVVMGVPCQAADEQQMRVFKVFDGDSLLLRTRAHSLRVQLAGIDAPELSQPGGQFSLKVLEKMVLGQRVRLIEVGTNEAGEPLVTMHRLKYDIALELVRAGAAWVTPDGSASLRAAEAEARMRGQGIWAEDAPAPIPPWQWRSGQSE